jgi:hypothetical protein
MIMTLIAHASENTVHDQKLRGFYEHSAFMHLLQGSVGSAYAQIVSICVCFHVYEVQFF